MMRIIQHEHDRLRLEPALSYIVWNIWAVTIDSLPVYPLSDDLASDSLPSM